ncbi:hypothetical protein AGMMS49957_03780 [Synergistales bacterium]|nr:hypothetical protein AGMMS49957_03780 [Synergistales bacterium]
MSGKLLISSAHHSEGESFESNDSVTIPVNRGGGGGGGDGCDVGIAGAAGVALLAVAVTRRRRG